MAQKLLRWPSEGIFDAMGNIYKGVAKALRSEKSFDGEFPTIYEGVRGMMFIRKSGRIK